MQIKHIRILLIDDDEDDRDLFAAAVQETSPEHLCETAVNGQEGLKLLEEMSELPDLIFLDLNMPLMHGFECLRLLKEHVVWRDIPVIIYSTSSNRADVERAAELGASAYLSKPNEYAHLCIKLKNILELDLAGTVQEHQYLGII
jgi:CheY-like chemotaxis protein